MLSGKSGEIMGVSMSKLWHKVAQYYLTHDGIEMFLFACIWASIGWMLYHVVIGIAGRIMG